MECYWHIGARQAWRVAEVFPRTPGPFLRADRENQLGRELVIGQWGLVPWLARSPTTRSARWPETPAWGKPSRSV